MFKQFHVTERLARWMLQSEQCAQHGECIYADYVDFSIKSSGMMNLPGRVLVKQARSRDYQKMKKSKISTSL